MEQREEEEVKRAEELLTKLTECELLRQCDIFNKGFNGERMGLDAREVGLKLHRKLLELKEEGVAYFLKLLGKEAFRRLRKIRPGELWIRSDWEDGISWLVYSRHRGGKARNQRKGFWSGNAVQGWDLDSDSRFYYQNLQSVIIGKLVELYPASVLLGLVEKWEEELPTAECARWERNSRVLVGKLLGGGQEDLQRLVLEFAGVEAGNFL